MFTIVEGPRVSIDWIVIRGNRALGERQIKAAMATRERRLSVLYANIGRAPLAPYRSRKLPTDSADEAKDFAFIGPCQRRCAS